MQRNAASGLFTKSSLFGDVVVNFVMQELGGQFVAEQANTDADCGQIFGLVRHIENDIFIIDRRTNAAHADFACPMWG